MARSNRHQRAVAQRSARNAGEKPVPSTVDANSGAIEPSAPRTGSALLDGMPAAVTEPLHYFIARSQMADDAKALPQRIGVTSCTSGDGVTTVARALAAVMVTDLDAKVCLVDLSARPPSLPGVGLSGIVDDGTPVERALLASADERLSVLVAGTDDMQRARTLARSTELGAALTQLDAQFDFVVFDVPPVLEGSDALTLLRHTDGYLLVVRHGVTTVDQIKAVSEELRSLRSLGVVMNQFTTRIPKRLRWFFAA
jgi:Mrp family chromosome partitioning ATPase